MRRWLALLVLAPNWSAAIADDAIIECLQEHITIEAEMGERIPLPTAEFTVTNGLSHAISGLHYKVVVREQDRSVPWLSTETGLSIPGGIEPGETRTLYPYLGSISPDAGADLTIDVEILDAADAQKSSIVGNSIYQDWSDEPSEYGCP